VHLFSNINLNLDCTTFHFNLTAVENWKIYFKGNSLSFQNGNNVISPKIECVLTLPHWQFLVSFTRQINQVSEQWRVFWDKIYPPNTPAAQHIKASRDLKQNWTVRSRWTIWYIVIDFFLANTTSAGTSDSLKYYHKLSRVTVNNLPQ